MVKDWTKIQKKYRGLWVALAKDEKTVMGSGKTLRQAIEQSKKRGYEDPIMARMPTEVIPYIGIL